MCVTRSDARSLKVKLLTVSLHVQNQIVLSEIRIAPVVFLTENYGGLALKRHSTMAVEVSMVR